MGVAHEDAVNPRQHSIYCTRVTIHRQTQIMYAWLTQPSFNAGTGVLSLLARQIAKDKKRKTLDGLFN